MWRILPNGRQEEAPRRLEELDYQERRGSGRRAPLLQEEGQGRQGEPKQGGQLLEAEEELEFTPSPGTETAPDTEAELVQTADVPVAVDEAKFFIDPSWYDQRGLVFQLRGQGPVLPGYACPSSAPTTDERVPVVDPKSKRVSFEVRQVRYGAKPLTVLRDCCSGKRDYVTPETPLMEAIFRVFLANGNQPMTIATLREHLLTYMPEMAALRSDSEISARLIDGDNRYGMKDELPAADKSYGMREQELLAAV